MIVIIRYEMNKISKEKHCIVPLKQLSVNFLGVFFWLAI